tara:strand:+ start:17061 stop:18149 length:1089 start_codon:yes stop_codon:yes gene_type:complete
MPPKFNGFTVEEPSSTRVDMPMPIVDNPRRHGLISEYNPNLIDKIGNLVPDTGIGGVLKGLYSGTDRNLFGMLPSGNYETVSPESDLGEDISFLADPIAGAKGLKYAVSGGTPVSKLLANSIYPETYSNKWQIVKRVLTDKKLFKGAAIDDMPQYEIAKNLEDRLFAWRTKFGLGKPNPKYNQNLDMRRFHNYNIDKSDYHKAIGFELRGKKGTELTSGQYLKRMKSYEQNTPIDRLWNKFGTHTEDGKKYYHYKNPEDYYKGAGRAIGDQHTLFGGYSRKIRNKKKFDYKTVSKEDYYDNWDFALNKPLKSYHLRRHGGDGWPTVVQRSLAEALLKPLEFKGTAKKIFRKRTALEASEYPF